MLVTVGTVLSPVLLLLTAFWREIFLQIFFLISLSSSALFVLAWLISQFIRKVRIILPYLLRVLEASIIANFGAAAGYMLKQHELLTALTAVIGGMLVWQLARRSKILFCVSCLRPKLITRSKFNRTAFYILSLFFLALVSSFASDAAARLWEFDLYFYRFTIHFSSLLLVFGFLVLNLGFGYGYELGSD